MAYDEHFAELFRADLARDSGITEKAMFGGLCFMMNGNMLCGVDAEGGMARIGKENEAEALEYEGVDPLSFTGRRMGGMVELDETAMEDREIRLEVLALAKQFVGALPPKRKTKKPSTSKNRKNTKGKKK